MKKKLIGRVFIAGLSLFSLFYLSEYGMAASVEESQQDNIVSISNEKNPIVDTEEIFTEMLEAVGHSKALNDPFQFMLRNSIGGGGTEFSNFTVRQYGDPRIENESQLYVGESILTNDLDYEQPLKTNTFSKTMTNTVSTQVTTGFMIGTEAKASFGIPLVGATEISLKGEFNFSNAQTNETSESFTYGIEAQEIVVKPNSSVRVRVYLNTADISGDVNLLTKPTSKFGDVEGNFYYGPNVSQITKSIPFSYNWATLTREVHNLNLPIDMIEYDVNNSTPQLVGRGTYNANYGTTFYVHVEPVNLNSETKSYSYIVE